MVATFRKPFRNIHAKPPRWLQCKLHTAKLCQLRDTGFLFRECGIEPGTKFGSSDHTDVLFDVWRSLEPIVLERARWSEIANAIGCEAVFPNVQRGRDGQIYSRAGIVRPDVVRAECPFCEEIQPLGRVGRERCSSCVDFPDAEEVARRAAIVRLATMAELESGAKSPSVDRSCDSAPPKTFRVNFRDRREDRSYTRVTE